MFCAPSGVLTLWPTAVPRGALGEPLREASSGNATMSGSTPSGTGAITVGACDWGSWGCVGVVWTLLGSDGALPYIVPRVAELRKVGEDPSRAVSRARASTVPDAAVGGGVVKTVLGAAVAGAAA